MKWVRTPPAVGGRANQPSDRDIKLTPSLWNASIDDAVRFGGEVTRMLLGSCPLANDRRYVTVDSKIHMLMPGMLPAIPGWHTDGVPRRVDGSPAAGGPPLLDVQQAIDEQGRGPRYHLLVTGDHCSTEFLTDPFEFLPTGPPADLYAEMTRAVNAHVGDGANVIAAPNSTWVTWDWWNIHRAVPANAAGWRLLVRVTESDFLPPQNDIRDVIRLHNPVYVPEVYGW